MTPAFDALNLALADVEGVGMSAVGPTETSRQRDGTAALPSTADILGECGYGG